jgi:hypothetical protein
LGVILGVCIKLNVFKISMGLMRPLVNAYFEHVQNIAFELAVAYPAALRSLTAAAR